MAPFDGLVAWWKWSCGSCEIEALFLWDEVRCCETGIELFVGDGAFFVDADKVLGLFGNGWLVL